MVNVLGIYEQGMGLKLTLEGTGILPPSYPMTSGQPAAGAVPDGNVMVGENEMEVPPLLAVIASVPLFPDFVNVAVSDDGLGAIAPPS